MTLGEKIRELRTERGWTLEDLAQRTGKRMVTIHRWEKDRQFPRLVEFSRLAEAFEIPLGELWSGVTARAS